MKGLGMSLDEITSCEVDIFPIFVASWWEISGPIGIQCSDLWFVEGDPEFYLKQRERKMPENIK